MKVYRFEEGQNNLELLPMAARRALDGVGRHLSLNAWQGLNVPSRAELAELGSERLLDLPAITAWIERHALATREVESLKEDPQAEAGEELLRHYAPYGALQSNIWSALSPLDRYVLEKCTKKPRAERLQAAYEEIVGASRFSTHLAPEGGIRMVDVGGKAVTHRIATAASQVRMLPATFEMLKSEQTPKGNVLNTAQLAGIMAAKKTPDLIPLCHGIPLSKVKVGFEFIAPDTLRIEATTETQAATGVEMEAMVAVQIAALTVYDMLKGVDRGMELGPCVLLSKSGGRSGEFRRG